MTELTELEDAALLARFNDGDAAAFEVLLQRYERPIYNFILRSVRDPDTASDLLQDTFLRVVQRSEDFKGQSKFSTWLYTIARNLCIDTSRKRVHRRHRSLDAPARRGSDPGGDPLVERVEGQERGADRAMTGARLQELIAGAVEELPDDQREVFLMRQVQGLPFRDIAGILGIPENTVKSRMRYALARLQQALAQYKDYVEDLK
jgi:RNA polymerase sigma-70 factor (ECF subfamily)